MEKFELTIDMYNSGQLLARGLVYTFREIDTYNNIVKFMEQISDYNYTGNGTTYQIVIEGIDNLNTVKNFKQININHGDKNIVFNIINRIKYSEFNENNLISNALSIVKNKGQLRMIQGKLSLENLVIEPKLNCSCNIL